MLPQMTYVRKDTPRGKVSNFFNCPNLKLCAFSLYCVRTAFHCRNSLKLKSVPRNRPRRTPHSALPKFLAKRITNFEIALYNIIYMYKIARAAAAIYAIF